MKDAWSIFLQISSLSYNLSNSLHIQYSVTEQIVLGLTIARAIRTGIVKTNISHLFFYFLDKWLIFFLDYVRDLR